ncbi:MAG: ferredoxin--NADP reductase domain-containing protein [Vulcanimicrobiaceae bacterium]
MVGSGPSGLYVADALVRQWPDASVDVFDALPTPYGLVRGGIAPDHQNTKAVIRALERTLAREGTRFLGNVEIGRDLHYDELKNAYDLVILSIGAEHDRALGIPGEHLPEVYGSAAFVGWYNGHPRHRHLEPFLAGSSLAVIGNGNVALDIVRLLAKTPAELATSDLSLHVAQAIAKSSIRDLYLIGRRGPVEASFTPIELAELGELERCATIVDPAALSATVGAHVPEKEIKVRQRNLDILRGFSERTVDGAPMRIHILFQAAPAAIVGEDHVRGLLLDRTRLEAGNAVRTGEQFELAVDTVIAATGYRTVSPPGVPFDEKRGVVANSDGLVEPGVYASGWCQHGPRGVVGTNRTDATALIKRIAADLEQTPLSPGKPGGAQVDRLLAERSVHVVDFEAWRRIDALEVAKATHPKPREKFVTTDALLQAALLAQ